MDAPAIGIDLGTTYSCVAVFQHGKVEIIANDQGSRITPSYVAFTDTDDILVGEPAKNQATRNLHNTIFDVKRLMGRKFDDVTVQADMKHWPFQVIDDRNKPKIKVELGDNSSTYYPEEISSKILLKMKETAQAYLGKTVKNAVITVPAYFNDSQRAATVDAAAIAGLNVLRIINEPTAAAIAYGLEKTDYEEQNVLIFDLGGGTFDVSVLLLKNGVFEVISTAGDTHLGGEDFNNRIVDHFVQEYKRKYNKDLSQNKKALRNLRVASERAKRILSSATAADIDIDSHGIDFYSSISRARFEELNADHFRRAIALVEKALQDAEVDKTQIHNVVLVGGSSRIPKMQKMLQNFFDGKELNQSINPDEAVAYGAAVQAAILNGDRSKHVRNIVLMDVTPLSLGIATRNKDELGSKMYALIKRNTPTPATRTAKCCTIEDNQTTASIKVYEGEHPLTKDNHLLGQFTLTGIPPAPAGKGEIDVTFEIDANGILNVAAVEKSTGSSNQLTITYDKGRLSKDEVARIIKDAEKYRIKEKKQKAALAAKDALESYCIEVMSIVQDKKLNDTINKFDKDMILKKCKETIIWLNSDQTAEETLFEEKEEELRSVFDTIIAIARYPDEKIDIYFEMLNLTEDASKKEIQTAVRELASEYHPDKYQGDKELNNMYWLTVMKARDDLIDLAKKKSD